MYHNLFNHSTINGHSGYFLCCNKKILISIKYLSNINYDENPSLLKSMSGQKRGGGIEKKTMLLWFFLASQRLLNI